jgi:uncharacterized membrane protein YkvA (DUF1232 family)
MTKRLALKPDIAQSFEQSLKVVTEHHYAIERLAKDLKAFEGRVDRELAGNSTLMETQIRTLMATARDFLALCRRDGAAEHVPYCLAAVDYLLNSEDAVTDFTDYDGFEDDVEVFRQVVDRFNLRIKSRLSAA